MANDEIDLSQLFIKVGDSFRAIGNGIVRFLALLRNTPLKNKVLFTFLVVAGGVGGFFYSTFAKKKFYESSMIISSDYLNKRIVDNAMEKLNLLANEKNHSGLAKALNVSDTLANNVAEFEVRPFVAEKDLIDLEVLKEQLKNAFANNKNDKIVGQVVKSIEIENRHAFEFSVKSYNPTSLKKLQVALTNYFKDNDYIKKRIVVNHENLLARREKLKSELNKLDSLKYVIYSNYKMMAEQTRQGSNNVILSDKAVTNPVEVYNEDFEIYDQLQYVQRQIFLHADFEVVDGFSELTEPTSLSRTKIILIAILIGFLSGYIIVALKNFNNYLSTFS